MAPAEWLLARALRLLGIQQDHTVATVQNSQLLDALAAGERHGVLVVAELNKACAQTPRAAAAAAEAVSAVGAAASRPEVESASSLLPGHDNLAASMATLAGSSRVSVEAVGAPSDDALPAAEKAVQEMQASNPEDAQQKRGTKGSIDMGLSTQKAPSCMLSVHTPELLPLHLAGCPAVHLSRACSDASGVGSSSSGVLPSTEEELFAVVSITLLPTGPSLSSLQNLLQLVLVPLLAAQQLQGPAVAAISEGLHATNSSHSLDNQPAESSALPDTGQDSTRERDATVTGTCDMAASGIFGKAGDPSGSTAAGLPAAAELLKAIHKFVGQVGAAAKHLRSEVAVQLPAGIDLSDTAAAAASEGAVLACERCMEEWVHLSTSVLQREAAARPEGRGPLPELEFWQARAKAYGGLLEQLSVPAVRAVVEVVERGSSDAALPASFRAQLSELGRLALDARDNARFLATLERHFQALATGSMDAVADAVQPMLNALRMIWIISRHYGDDVHMSNLLERIAQGLQDRLDGALGIGTLFRAPAANSLALVGTCLAIARGWQAHYMAQREKIEASGHHARWEFSRALLFERTNHVAEVCGELEGMLRAVDDFRKFLGPELNAVTGNTAVIEEVSVMVSAMVEPVEGVAFNPFDRQYAAEWRAVQQRFARDADDIKLATRDVIDACFRKLRSVDAAAQLLHSFQRIQTQGAMQKQMADKLTSVLEHFINEIAVVQRLFEDGRDKPPLARNMPPVAGAVKWSRGLLARLRCTWLRLQGLDSQLEELEPGRRAAAAMTELAKEMLKFEKARFATWSASVGAAITAGLQQPLLRRQAVVSDSSSAGFDPGEATSSPGAAAGSGGTQGGAGGAAKGAGRGPTRVVINFPPALLRIMREAKYLDQQGFGVPPLAVNLALQEGQLRDHFHELGAMLERHSAASACLRSAERALLGQQLATLDAVLEPGLTRLNWTSLTIPNFVTAVNKAAEQFGALVARVQKNTSQIERTLHHISRAQLIPAHAPNSNIPGLSQQTPAAADPAQPGAAPEGLIHGAAGSSTSTEASSAAGKPAKEPASAGTDVPDLQEFYEDFEQHRQQVVGALVAQYHAVGPLLMKVEELVAGSATGKSPRLAGYYAYWERRLFSAVCGMVVSALQALHDRLRACRPVGADAAEGDDVEALAGQRSKPPLFRVALSLLPPEVTVVPSTAEAGRQLGRLLRNVVESSKAFVRWMDGTCLEAPEQHVYGEDAEPFVFSFFSDVSQSPTVIRAMLVAQQEVQRALAGVGKAAERWRSYASLWRVDRASALAKFRARKPSQAVGEEKLAQYHRVGEDAWAAGADHDVHFIRVRCAPLASAVRAEAQAWVRGIAGVMAEAEAPELEALRQQAANLLATVQQQAVEADDVDRIQGAVTAAQDGAAAASAACADLAHHCRARWAFVVPPDETALQAELAGVHAVQSAWQQLVAAAKARAQGCVQLARLTDTPTPGSDAAAASPEDSLANVRRGSSVSVGSRNVLPRGSSSAATLQRTASVASTASASGKLGGGAKRAPSRQQA